MVRPGAQLLAAFALVAAGCSGSDAQTVDHCTGVTVAVDAGVLADDLVSPDISAQALRDRLDRAIGAAADAVVSADAGAAAAWGEVEESLRALREQLAGSGFDLVLAAAPPEPESDAPVRDDVEVEIVPTAIDVYGGQAVTAARQAAAADARNCGLNVAEPGPVILALGGGVEVTSLDPRSTELTSLPADQLAALAARSFSQAELDEVLARHEVVSVSQLARVLIASPIGDPLARETLDELRRRVVVDGPGDDEALDALYDACVDEGLVACDLLVSLAPVGSEYAAVGETCGGRRDPTTDVCGEADLR